VKAFGISVAPAAESNKKRRVLAADFRKDFGRFRAPIYLVLR